MTKIGWTMIGAISQVLGRDERETVLGDLIEAGDGAWRGLLEVLGLIVRHQVLLWKTWQPWLAAFGVALPSSLFLMGTSVAVSRTFKQFTGPEFFGATGTVSEAGLPSVLYQLCLLAGWAWTSGFVVGSLSRRTVWVSAVLSALPCLFCLSKFRVEVMAMSRLSLLLFLPPAIWGVWQGVRTTRVKLSSAIAMAVTTIVVTVISTWGKHSSWLIHLALIWPGWYLVTTATATAARRRFN